MKKLFVPICFALLASCSSDIEEIGNGTTEITTTSFQINEHLQNGNSIGTIVVNNGNNAELSFTVDSDIDIQIDENTGQLTVGENTVLDFESISSHTITVSVFDGTSITDTDITIQLTDIDEYEALNDEQKEIVDYLKLLTLWQGPSSGGINFNTRWEEPMNLYLDGQISTNYKTTVEEIIDEYNTLLEDSSFSISLVETEQDSNAHLFFGTKASVENIWSDMFEEIEDGSFVGFAMTSNFNSALNNSRIWISNEIASLTKHELGHALGFGHSDKCDEDSFMCSTVNANSDFLDIEKEVIRLSYHPDMQKGLSDEEIDFYISNILLSE